MSLLGLIVLVFGVAAWIVGSKAAGAIEHKFVKPPYDKPPKTLPESRDPALASRSRELAAWNDPRTWRGCSDYPPPSSVKPVERQ